MKYQTIRGACAALAVAVVPMRPDPMIVTVDATTAILRVSVFTSSSLAALCSASQRREYQG